MDASISSVMLWTLFVSVFAGIVTVAGVSISLMLKHSCPHCRTLMPKKALACPHCGKAALQTT